MKKSIIIASAFALLSATQISADRWSLDSCISYAVTHNISVLQQQLRVSQGEQGIVEAKDRFLPSLSASASESFSFGRGLTSQNTYADRNTSNFGWNVGMSLPLFQGMSEYRNLKLARLSLEQYILESEATRQSIELNVITQYLQVLYSKEVAAAARASAELSAFQLTRQRALIEAGKVAEATVYDLEAVAAQDSLQIVTADNDVASSLVTLANLLRLPSSEGFDINPLPESEPTIPTYREVYQKALSSQASILSAEQAIKVADQNIEVARSGYLPRLNFTAGIGSGYYKLSGMPGEGFGAQMRHNYATNLGFSLSIPIFDGFGTRNNLRRAKLQKSASELELDDRRENLKKEIELAHTQASGARLRYLTAIGTLDKTRLSFDSTRERYDLGRATIADYEQAKNNLFRTEISLIQARYEYLMRHRILQFYAGGDKN